MRVWAGYADSCRSKRSAGSDQGLAIQTQQLLKHSNYLLLPRRIRKGSSTLRMLRELRNTVSHELRFSNFNIRRGWPK
jgi:hypothetical protein